MTDETDPPRLFACALQLHQDGNAAAAMAACRSALCEHPDHAPAHNLMGVLHARAGRGDPALRAFRVALRCRPAFGEPLLNTAHVLDAIGRGEAAAAVLRRFVALDPVAASGHAVLGEALRAHGDLDGAFAMLRRALLIDPASGRDRWNFLMIAHAGGHLDRVAAGLRRFLADDPGNPNACGFAGGTALARGDLAEARSMLRRAETLDPGRSEGGQALLRCERYRRAVDDRTPGRSDDRGREAPPGLVVRGHFAGVSGYSHMTDRFVNGLLGRGVPVDVVGLFGSEEWPGGTSGAPGARAVLNFLVPAGLEVVPGLRTALFSMFEGTRIPPAWRRLCERCDLVIVPAESSRRAWIAGGFPEERLRLCPLGVDPMPGPETPLDIRIPGGGVVSDRRLRFLNVSDFIARKNVDGLLRVWLKATAASDDAVLVLKLGKGNPRVADEFRALARQTEERVGRRLSDAAALAVVTQGLDEPAMGGLFRAATHYVSLSHGEGWDLPMSRAGAMGMRLIAPANSAYLDYLDDSVAHMVPCRQAPARKPYSADPWPPFHGIDWWDPDEDAAVAILRGILDGRDENPPDVRGHLLRRFTWAQATDRLIGVLREADLA